MKTMMTTIGPTASQEQRCNVKVYDSLEDPPVMRVTCRTQVSTTYTALILTPARQPHRKQSVRGNTLPSFHDLIHSALVISNNAIPVSKVQTLRLSSTVRGASLRTTKAALAIVPRESTLQQRLATRTLYSNAVAASRTPIRRTPLHRTKADAQTARSMVLLALPLGNGRA